MQPCNYSGFFNTTIIQRFGVVDYDCEYSASLPLSSRRRPWPPALLALHAACRLSTTFPSTLYPTFSSLPPSQTPTHHPLWPPGSNAKALWANQKPMDCEERLITQAAMTKAANPNTRVFVYRNLVKVRVPRVLGVRCARAASLPALRSP